MQICKPGPLHMITVAVGTYLQSEGQGHGQSLWLLELLPCILPDGQSRSSQTSDLCKRAGASPGICAQPDASSPQEFAFGLVTNQSLQSSMHARQLRGDRLRCSGQRSLRASKFQPSEVCQHLKISSLGIRFTASQRTGTLTQ